MAAVSKPSSRALRAVRRLPPTVLLAPRKPPRPPPNSSNSRCASSTRALCPMLARRPSPTAMRLVPMAQAALHPPLVPQSPCSQAARRLPRLASPHRDMRDHHPHLSSQVMGIHLAAAMARRVLRVCSPPSSHSSSKEVSSRPSRGTTSKGADLVTQSRYRRFSSFQQKH